MKMKNLVGLCAIALLSASCGNEDFIENESKDNEFIINSTIAQSASTARVPELDQHGAGRFTEGDQNNLLFFKDGGSVIKNVEYTYGQTYYWHNVGLPSDVESCNMVAWYPMVSASNPASFAWDVMDQQENPDFLAASQVKVSPSQKTQIELTFKHLMHKLHVEITSENPSVSTSDLQNATITCKNFLPTANINLMETSLAEASGKAATLNKKGAKADFIVPAQAVGTMEIVLNVKGKTANFKMSEVRIDGRQVESLESGKTLSLNIKVTKNDFVISGQNISGWENQGDFNDSIIL